jgi:hypothetical protein
MLQDPPLNTRGGRVAAGRETEGEQVLATTWKFTGLLGMVALKFNAVPDVLVNVTTVWSPTVVYETPGE